MREPINEITILVPSQSDSRLSPPGSRRMTGDNTSMNEMALVASRRPSYIAAALRRPSNVLNAQRRMMMELIQGTIGSKQSININTDHPNDNYLAIESRKRNRRLGE